MSLKKKKKERRDFSAVFSPSSQQAHDCLRFESQLSAHISQLRPTQDLAFPWHSSLWWQSETATVGVGDMGRTGNFIQWGGGGLSPGNLAPFRDPHNHNHSPQPLFSSLLQIITHTVDLFRAMTVSDLFWSSYPLAVLKAYLPTKPNQWMDEHLSPHYQNISKRWQALLGFSHANIEGRQGIFTKSRGSV